MVVEEYDSGVGRAGSVGGGVRDDEQEVFIASQWQLMWWRFRSHKLAMISGVVLLGFYLIGALCGFLSHGDANFSDYRFAYMKPQKLHWFHEDGFGPYVYGVDSKRNPETLKMEHFVNEEVRHPISFFVRQREYKFIGIFKTDIRFMGIAGELTEADSVVDERPFPYLLGSDKLGRDMWSRILEGTRISLSIGLVGVFISMILGITMGGLSGFYGGWVDTIIQRIIEITRSIPTIPLWIALAAAVPRDWDVFRIYFAITIIISLLAWTELGRVVRGRFLALREEEFVMAAKLTGANDVRIIFRHMVPAFLSHIIAAASLAIPFMIISETALSFLGLGLRAPAISYGVLLQAAQNVQSVAVYPWLMIPAFPVTVVVLAFNFMGDGLRDAADPYGSGGASE